MTADGRVQLAIILALAAIGAGLLVGGALRIGAPSLPRTGQPSSASAAPPESPLSAPGPHRAGWRQVTVRHSTRDAFTAVFYYPASTRGEEGAYDGSAAPYPAIAFGHGFVQTPQRYRGTLEHLATWGYFVIAPESHAGLAPNHTGLANDLLAALAWLANQNESATDWLAGQVDTRHRGLLGHSMGGGAALLAVAADPMLSAVATLAAADTVPSAGGGLAAVRVPLAFLVGSEDRLVPPSRTEGLYRAARPPKQLATIKGGSHCGFQDDPFPIGCDRGSLPSAEQLAITRARLTAFFNVYLKGDVAQNEAVWGAPNDERVVLVSEREEATGGAYLPLGLHGQARY